MIQDHVTSLDLSKQLYEAGIVVENPLISWKWSDLVPGEVLVINGGAVPISGKIHSIPAPISSELGELFGSHLSIQKGSKLWHCSYWWGVELSITRGDVSSWHETDDKTLANALAKMLLYLKEKGLL